MSVIIGIDPGSRVTGYGVIRSEDRHLEGLACGVIDLGESESLPQRLNELAKNLRTIFKQYKPTQVAVEKIFLGKNPDSAFKLGHARGVCLQIAAEFNAEVFEYATRSVKKTVTGSGAAEKEQVKIVVEGMLKMRCPYLDASDALAVAIAHSYSDATILKTLKLKKMKEIDL
ncbi:MAG: crossover junction endodeoxyribonuclease RuvC [Bdellovibrionota bacterium]